MGPSPFLVTRQRTGCFSPVCTSAMGVSPNYQTKANEYTIIPAINEINSVILTKSFAGIRLLLHRYCISIEASIPTIQDRINTIIPDLFAAYAIAKEHNAITTTEVIILFFFIYATSIAYKKSPLIHSNKGEQCLWTAFMKFFISATQHMSLVHPNCSYPLMYMSNHL